MILVVVPSRGGATCTSIYEYSSAGGSRMIYTLELGAVALVASSTGRVGVGSVAWWRQWWSREEWN